MQIYIPVEIFSLCQHKWSIIILFFWLIYLNIRTFILQNVDHRIEPEADPRDTHRRGLLTGLRGSSALSWLSDFLHNQPIFSNLREGGIWALGSAYENSSYYFSSNQKFPSNRIKEWLFVFKVIYKNRSTLKWKLFFCLSEITTVVHFIWCA